MDLRESEWARQGRPVHTYTVPESLRGEGVPEKIGVVQLTAAQELTASKIGGLDFTKSQYAAAKMSIVQFDGRPVDAAAAEVDKFWERADPRVRSLIISAYNRLSSPKKEEEDSFFASEAVSV